MKQRPGIMLTLMAGLILGAIGCQPSSSPGPMRVRFGALPILDVLPVYVAQVEGYFVQAGLEVEVV
ncbi:MAG: hypothetical protein RMM10_12890, partial [Anaerolineae bacterium]